MRNPQSLLAARSTLVVAEPGHELRVYGWLEVARPMVQVVADGVARGRQPRLESTLRVLERAGACPGPVLGKYSCQELYQAVLSRDYELFDHLADELADSLSEHDVELVLGDAAEGKVLVHDLVRYVIDAAVARASQRTGREIENYEFAVAAPPDSCPADLRYRSLRLHLYDEAFDRKLQAAVSYPQLGAQVEAAFREFGAEAFRVECFWPARRREQDACENPAWERRGEQLVAEGEFQTPVRFRDHVAPLLAVLAPDARLVA